MTGVAEPGEEGLFEMLVGTGALSACGRGELFLGALSVPPASEGLKVLINRLSDQFLDQERS